MNAKIILIGLLLLLASVYANSAELNGTCGGESVQCELTLSEMELCNTSNYEERYTAYFEGEYAKWFNVLPNRITLEAGECKQLEVYTVAGCYDDPGTYTSQLTISNGEKITTTCSIDLEQGHFIEIEVSPKRQEATQCEEKVYDLTISNNTIVPNQQIERVDIKIDGLPRDWYTLEEERILVSKNEPETVELKVQAPCDAEFGNYEFTARASLPNPNFFDEDNGEYLLGQGQNVKIDFGTDFDTDTINACLEKRTSAEITIENTGKLSDNFEIELEGANFASLEKSRISLSPGEKETIGIEFRETNMDTGEYEFGIEVISTVYDYAQGKKFTADLRDCYNLEVEKLSGSEVVCVEDKPIYEFELTNNRTEIIELNAEIEGINAELSDKTISLRPGEKKVLRAELDVANLAKEARVERNDLAIELIIDSSGSMQNYINGKNKMETAKGAIINLVNNINEVDMGMRVFGQGDECAPSELAVPVNGLNIERITEKTRALNPTGKTPMTEALRSAINDFPTGKGKAIILVSDGKETCEGNISATARALRENGITVYSIGFDIDEDGKEQLEEISYITNGKYFDAKKPEELIRFLQEISKELEITPSSTGMKTFTLELDSEYFDYEEDFRVEVNDCYNAAFVVPEMNLCHAVAKEQVFSIANLGSEEQEFTINYSENWIEGKESIIIAPNTEVTVPFTARAPEGTETNTYKITAESNRITMEQEKNINYLPFASCFGIDMILIDSELNAETCEGVKQTLYIENNGTTTQEVEISADKEYVHIVDEKISVETGERKEVNFFVSPPFDLAQTTFIELTAKTNRGFETSTEIKLIVSGNQDDFGLGEADMRVKNLSIREVEGLDYDVEVSFELLNDSNRTMEVFNAESLEYDAVIQIEKRFIPANETTNARLLITLPEDFNRNKIIAPIRVETDEGTFTRTLTFDYDKEKKGKVEEPIPIGTGLFTLANLSTALIAILIIVIIALIGFTIYQSQKTNETIETETPKETKTPKKEKSSRENKINELKSQIIKEETPKTRTKTTKKKTTKKK